MTSQLGSEARLQKEIFELQNSHARAIKDFEAFRTVADRIRQVLREGHQYVATCSQNGSPVDEKIIKEYNERGRQAVVEEKALLDDFLDAFHHVDGARPDIFNKLFSWVDSNGQEEEISYLCSPIIREEVLEKLVDAWQRMDKTFKRDQEAYNKTNRVTHMAPKINIGR